jgi:hypothetical protein
VFFKSNNFFPIVLQQKLTALAFASYCSGSLGLFLGFSILSLIEIIYYLTMRVVCHRIKLKKIGSNIEEEPQRSKTYLVEFLDSSSIHGFKQIGMKKWHFVERYRSQTRIELVMKD